MLNRWVVTLFVATTIPFAGCRDNREDVTDEVGQCDPDLFEEPAVAAIELRLPRIRSHPKLDTPELAVARGDDADEYEVGVIMRDTAGRQVFRDGMSWEIQGNEKEFDLVVTRVGTPDENYYIAIVARSDLFDAADANEPEGGLVACVENRCPACPDNCDLELCTELVVMRGVVNLEGDWWLSGDPLPPGEFGIEIAQTGRDVDAIGFDIRPVVIDNQVYFSTFITGQEEQCFAGTILPTRDRIEGTSWACKTKEPRGNWLAWRAQQ